LGEPPYIAGETLDANDAGVIELGVDPKGKLQVQPISGIDSVGRTSFNSTFGDKIVAERITNIVVSFNYNISDEDVKTTLVDTGTATAADSMLSASSGTGTTGAVNIESVDVVRYIPGRESFAYFTAMFPNGGVATSTQHIGLFASQDGFYLGYTNTNLIVGYRRDSVDTEVISTSWNGSPRVLTEFDFAKLNIFRISYGWLGTAPVNFEIMTATGEWLLMHQFPFPGTLTTTIVLNPTLPICIDVTKTAGAEDIIVKSASWSAGTQGSATTKQERTKTVSNSVTGITTEVLIINVRNQANFQGIENRVVARSFVLAITTDGPKPVTLRVYKDLTIATPTWVDVDATNSVLQTDILGTPTYDLTKLEDVLTFGRIDSQVFIIDPKGAVLIRPGEDLTISAESSGAGSDVTLAIRYQELF
jgi:hypothetical protein